jgi:hypothetical protein
MLACTHFRGEKISLTTSLEHSLAVCGYILADVSAALL